MNTTEDVLSQKEWILIHIDLGYMPDDWYIGMTLNATGVIDYDEQGRFYVLDVQSGYCLYYPSSSDYITLPKCMFDDRELFLIKMTGGISNVEWESKMAYLDDIFDREN